MADSPGGRFPAKYQQIADYLRAQIAEGRLKPGDQLPGQLVLMDQFEVAMATVVRGLDELRREGLVGTKPGLGTFVLKREPSPEFVAVMKRLDEMEAEVTRLRRLVEGDGAQ
jgi:DNA-binding GntR family transcriptional regulator